MEITTQTDLERDLAEAWDIIYKSRTMLFSLKESLVQDAADKLDKELYYLEQAQSYIAKHLSKFGVGIDKFSGTEKMIMPSMSNYQRVDVAKNLPKKGD